MQKAFYWVQYRIGIFSGALLDGNCSVSSAAFVPAARCDASFSWPGVFSGGCALILPSVFHAVSHRMWKIRQPDWSQRTGAGHFQTRRDTFFHTPGAAEKRGGSSAAFPEGEGGRRPDGDTLKRAAGG